MLDRPVQVTGEGCFKVLGTEEVLFRRKERLFGYRWHTPFPMKGRVRWEGRDAVIEGRLSLGGILFYCAWLLGITIWCVITWNDPATQAWALAPWILVGGWLFGAAIVLWSAWYETKLARRIVGELTQALTKAAA
jgi:hypothetical protein